MSRRAWLLVGIAGSLVAGSLRAGTYIGSVDCSIANGCLPQVVGTDAAVFYNPDGITYPITYLPAGSSPNVNVCIDALGFGGSLVPIATWAVEKWNSLSPTSENCLGCSRNELGEPNPGGDFSAASVILHELGHCAMAIWHTTLIIGEPVPLTPPPPRHPTSWTISYDGSRVGLAIGTDNIRGSFDDIQFSAAIGTTYATNVFWFRTWDNNPVIVDSTVIDSATFSYDLNQLPTGHNWPANANHWVTTHPLLGFAPETVTVMSDILKTGAVYFDLTADDVNMVKMSRTGVDRVVGGVDDHQIQLSIVPCTGAEHIKIEVGTVAGSDTLGQCNYQTGFVFPAQPHFPAQDYKLQTAVGGRKIILNEDKPWDLRIPLWWNGFEIGNTSLWSDVEP